MAVKGAGNVTVTYNSNNITAYVNTAQIEASVAELDATDLASTATEATPGLASWTASFDLINFDKTIEGYLGDDLITPVSRALVIAYTDSASATATYTTTAFLTSGSIGGEATGSITGSYQLRITGAAAHA